MSELSLSNILQDPDSPEQEPLDILSGLRGEIEATTYSLADLESMGDSLEEIEVVNQYLALACVREQDWIRYLDLVAELGNPQSIAYVFHCTLQSCLSDKVTPPSDILHQISELLGEPYDEDDTHDLSNDRNALLCLLSEFASETQYLYQSQHKDRINQAVERNFATLDTLSDRLKRHIEEERFSVAAEDLVDIFQTLSILTRRLVAQGKVCPLEYEPSVSRLTVFLGEVANSWRETGYAEDKDWQFYWTSVGAFQQGLLSALPVSNDAAPIWSRAFLIETERMLPEDITPGMDSFESLLECIGILDAACSDFVVSFPSERENIEYIQERVRSRFKNAIEPSLPDSELELQASVSYYLGRKSYERQAERSVAVPCAYVEQTLQSGVNSFLQYIEDEGSLLESRIDVGLLQYVAIGLHVLDRKDEFWKLAIRLLSVDGPSNEDIERRGVASALFDEILDVHKRGDLSQCRRMTEEVYEVLSSGFRSPTPHGGQQDMTSELDTEFVLAEIEESRRFAEEQTRDQFLKVSLQCGFLDLARRAYSDMQGRTLDQTERLGNFRTFMSELVFSLKSQN